VDQPESRDGQHERIGKNDRNLAAELQQPALDTRNFANCPVSRTPMFIDVYSE
jgi:hypothetical protein